jgi:hypothetical protein
MRVAATFLIAGIVAVCAGPEVFGPVALMAGSSSVVVAEPMADSSRVKAVKVQTDSLRAETCRGGILQPNGSCSGRKQSARTSFIVRLANRVDSIEQASFGQPVPPPPDTVTPPPIDTVVPPPTGSLAELPRVVPASGDPYPSRSCSVTVAAGGNVNAALSAARGGQVVCLTASASYGQVTLPARVAGDTGWIVVRTATVLPAEGTRIKPSTTGSYATIATANSEPALRTTPGTHGWFIAGVRFATSAAMTYNIVTLGSGDADQTTLAAVPQRLILSRVVIDGGTTNVQNCLVLNSGATAVVDSWLANCHGKGMETHGIGSWNGPGPHLIQNTYIEASSINALWGGATPRIANLRASDITVRRNNFVAPSAWKGTWYPRKNLLEFKNATRILVEGNVMDGSWEEASHGGAAFWLKSINDDGNCSWCELSHITIRRNEFKNLGMGFAINGAECYASTGCSVFPKVANHIAIQDNLFTIVNASPFTGYGRGMHLTGGATDILLERNVIAGNVYMVMLAMKDRPVERVNFRDNVWVMGEYPLHVDPGGGAIADGIRNYLWERMTLIGSNQPATLPSSTIVSSESAAPLAAQIRATVAGAVAGVVILP